MSMKQNITLSLDKELIKKAKLLAAQQQVSISRMLGQKLREMVEDAERYHWARRKALEKLKEGFHLGGKITATKEELHERQSIR
jgi:predicted proteasome-type protease